MAHFLPILAMTLVWLANVQGTFIKGRWDSSYQDNGFDDSGMFAGDGGILGSGMDDTDSGFLGGSDFGMSRKTRPYIGGGVMDRGIGESISGGILGGGGMMDRGYGVNPKYLRSAGFGAGIGGMQLGIGGGMRGSRRSGYGKYQRRRISAGIGGFSRTPRRVIGMGGILGARRRWKMY